MEDIILQYTWPRIDAEVSKHRNHLLKAPFCVHPKTGRVCVPVDPTRIEEFDPAKVPTVGQLLKEIDESMVINNEAAAEEAHPLPGKPFILALKRLFLSHELSEGRRKSVRSPTPIGSRSRKLRSSECFLMSLTSYMFADLRRVTETDWEKTSLKPYVVLLDAHNKALMEETRRRKRGDKSTNVATSGSLSLLSAVDFGCCFITHEERACTQVGDDRACLAESLTLPSAFILFCLPFVPCL